MVETIILKPEEVTKELKEFPGWEFKDNKISKQFQFEYFYDALSFLNDLLPFVQDLDHHPDVHIYYNKILFELQRFDVGGKVTNKDFIVADEIERLYEIHKQG